MRITLPFCMLLLCATFGCSKDSDAETAPGIEVQAPVYEANAPATASVGKQVTIEVGYHLTDGCKTFHRLQAEKSGNNYTVIVYAKGKGKVCHQAITQAKTTYTFTPTVAGTYTFHFWQGHQNTITKTITVTN